MLLSLEEKLAKELRMALMTNQLILQFQPKINILKRKIIGAEVLLKWDHPTQGLIPADKWIALAESHGLMRPLTCWVIEKTIGYLQRPESAQLVLSVNISPSVFDGQMAMYILDRVKKSNIHSWQLELELTESVPIDNLTNLTASARLLQSHGLQISLDDFGSGYASMKYLVDIPLNTIKIDKTFIHKAPLSFSAELILQSMIELGRQIGLSVVCEGVESFTQLESILKLGGDIVQGYLTGKPTDFESFLATEVLQWPEMPNMADGVKLEQPRTA